MKGVFWNSTSLCDLAKTRYITKCIREHSLDFIALLETERKMLLQGSLTPYLVDRISNGIAYLPMEDPEASHLVSIWERLMWTRSSM